MPPLDDQFEDLRRDYPEASRTPLPSGATLIRIPELALPDGWSAKKTSVRFIAPLGYPHAKPDCFWADVGLRRANGTIPLASGDQNVPEVNEPGTWFSWHVGQWNPNKDTLLTFVKVIKQRFDQPQ